MSYIREHTAGRTDEISPFLPEDASLSISFYLNEELEIEHLQKLICSIIEEIIWEQLFAASDTRGQARLLSLKQKESARWLLTLSTESALQISDEHRRVMSRLRLGQQPCDEM